MNIIIIGCGKVGQELTEHLNEASNNITVVDTQQSKLNYIAARCDVLTVCGNGATHAVQQEAKIDTADLLIAVTGSDELNLLCCLIAKKAGNCHTIARVRSPQYLGEAPYLKDELGLAMVINPEFESAAEIARVLRFPSAMKIETFAKGRVELLKFKLPEGSPLVGMAVKEISSKLHCDVLICTIERNISPVTGADGEISEEAYIAYGDFVFEEKDVISIVATPRNANTFFKRINYKLNSAKDVMIVGGGSIAVYLCAILVKSGINVTLIDKDPQRCEELESMLDDVRIICGDGSDQETLLEEGLAEADGFVALTNLDEENILLSLYAKSRSKAKLCTKVNRIDFTDVIKKLDL
ncbi:MAG: Trk system potassium transporter TrkA, partial [Oscillospiraceae bacterium]